MSFKSLTCLSAQDRGRRNLGRKSIVVCTLIAALCTSGSLTAATRIGTRSDVIDHELDFHGASGHYFSVLRYDTASDDCFSVNLSTDEGSTWVETFEHCTGQELLGKIAAVVAGDFFYVAYVMETVVDSAKLMRFRWSDGEKDPIFGSQIVFSVMVGDSIRSFDLCSNADTFDDRLYFFAIEVLAPALHGDLRFFWTDQDGGTGAEPWNDVPTTLSGVGSILGATGNENYAAHVGYHPMVLWTGEGFDLGVWRYRPGRQANTIVDNAVYGTPSGISAYDDHVAINYWNQHYEMTTCLSDDGGVNFSCEFAQGVGNGFSGDVAARNGAGIAEMAVYDYDGDAPCWYRHRDYVGTWSDQVACTDLGVSMRGPISLESLPPHTAFSYGAVVESSDPETGSAYFIRSPVIFSDGFESGDTAAW